MKPKKMRSAAFASIVPIMVIVISGCDSKTRIATVPEPEPQAMAVVNMSGIAAGYMVAAGTYFIEAGQDRDVGDVNFACEQDGEQCTVMVDQAGMATSTGGMVTASESEGYRSKIQGKIELATANEKVRILTAAVREETASGEALEKIAEKISEAVKYAEMLDTASVQGESGKAQGNAAKVLEAKAAIAEAISAIEEARTAAQEAKMQAMELQDGEETVQAVEAVLRAIEQDLKEAMEGAMDEALIAAVSMVTNPEGEEEDPGKTATYHGEEVATTVGDSIKAKSTTDGTANRAMHHVAIPILPEGVEAMDDSEGMRWNERAKGLKTMRIATGTEMTMQVQVAPVQGMAAADVNNTLVAGGGYSDGEQVGGSRYLGIEGTAICAGDDCDVDMNGVLEGSWYFTPSEPTKLYVEDPQNEGQYTEEVDYASYGHWLEVNETSKEATVNTFAYTRSTGEPEFGLTATLDDETATYIGQAAGMSVHKEFDNNAQRTGISAGAFTAEVELEATFGAQPMIEGKIDGFRGPAVDERWEVELEAVVFANQVESGSAMGTGGQEGSWTARGYGKGSRTPQRGIRGLQRALLRWPRDRSVRDDQGRMSTQAIESQGRPRAALFRWREGTGAVTQRRQTRQGAQQ